MADSSANGGTTTATRVTIWLTKLVRSRTVAIGAAVSMVVPFAVDELVNRYSPGRE
jgi:hypothetical protein